jgi:hypothetical protein
MRTALVILATIVPARLAAADIDRRCYAGIESMEIDGKTDRHPLVVVRELDRGASEIREESWTDVHSNDARHVVYKVDARTGTFALDSASNAATALKDGAVGTLDGAPWQWTGYHIKSARNAVEIVTDGEVRGDSLAATTTLSQNGKHGATFFTKANAFDCKELDQRRRALDPMSSKTATRSCYVGTASSSRDGTVRPATLVQIIDHTRIELRERVGDAKHERVTVLTVDRDKAMVNGVTPAQLIGKPGAWTAYSWTDSGAAMTETVEGTLGGAHATKKLTLTGAGLAATIVIDAKSVDCAKLTGGRP